MTKAALSKIFILVVLVFIICLPEFFTVYKVSKVHFLCLPYPCCEPGKQVKKGESGKIDDAEMKREDMCDPSQNAEQREWEKICTQLNQSNMTNVASDNGRSVNDVKKSWFICQTDKDMTELQSNISSRATALQAYLEMSVQLQLGEAETLNLTLYSHSNYSSLDLHPPEKQEEVEADEGQKPFYCCLPVLPTLETANQSCCLLWLANETVSTAVAKAKLPWKRTQKDEWRGLVRVLWLALLCFVLLSVVISVLGQIYLDKRPGKKPQVYHGYSVSGYITGQQVNDVKTETEIVTPTVLYFSNSCTLSELSPIREAQSHEDIEMLHDGNLNHCYMANLHHRGHSSTPSLTEEQQDQRGTDTDFT